jgi:hypothetical protein
VADVAEVYLHVGLPKTGTTSIQQALTAHADGLAAAGVLFPGGRHLAQRLAAYDLMGQRIPGEGLQVAGSFDRFVAEVRAFGGDKVLVSEEGLARARPRHVRRLLTALEGHRVFVVVTIRDLPSLLASAWQQSVMTGGVVPWAEFVSSVRNPAHGPASVSASFWLKHDVGRVLDVWGSAVPARRILLVTVPPHGSPPGVLLDRFGQAVGVPAATWSRGVRPHNVGLGLVETEVVRRLNGHLGGALPTMQYRRMVEDGLRSHWLAAGSGPPVLPPGDLAWALERSREAAAALAARGHPVFGDLAELVPRIEQGGSSAPGEPTDLDLLAATEAALAALATSYGSLVARHRRLVRSGGAPGPHRAATVRSVLEHWLFVLKTTALGLADRSGPVARAARRYARPSRFLRP